MQGALDNFASCKTDRPSDYIYATKALHIFIELGEMFDKINDMVGDGNKEEVDEIIEELIDIMHFVLGTAYSPFLMVNIPVAADTVGEFWSKLTENTHTDNLVNFTDDNLLKRFISTASVFLNLSKGLKYWKNDSGKKQNVVEATSAFNDMALSYIVFAQKVAESLGVSPAELTAAYARKNLINYERQFNGY